MTICVTILPPFVSPNMVIFFVDLPEMVRIEVSPVFGDNPCDRLSGIGRDLSRSGPYFGVRAGCRCSHLDPPANGQAVIHLTGLLEVFISESFILATVSDNSVRYQAINVVKR